MDYYELKEQAENHFKSLSDEQLLEYLKTCLAKTSEFGEHTTPVSSKEMLAASPATLRKSAVDCFLDLDEVDLDGVDWDEFLNMHSLMFPTTVCSIIELERSGVSAKPYTLSKLPNVKNVSEFRL